MGLKPVTSLDRASCVRAPNLAEVINTGEEYSDTQVLPAPEPGDVNWEALKPRAGRTWVGGGGVC